MKVGICGLGSRMAFLTKVFSRQSNDLEFVAYADPAPLGLPYLQAHGIDPGKAYTSTSNMVKSESLDFLMIGSPNHMHLQHIREGLRHGLKIFTEKPVVIDQKQTFELLDLLTQYGADNVIVGLVLRYSPLFRDVAHAIHNGVLGTISSMEASEHISPSHGAFFMRDWRRYAAFSGGFLLEKCCHDLDLYQGLVRRRPARVVSFGGRRTFVSHNRALENEDVYHEMAGGWSSAESVFQSDSDIVDHQTALIEYENGVSMCFHTNLNVPGKSRHFYIIGSDATAEGDFERNYFRLQDTRSNRILRENRYAFSDPLGHYGAEELMVFDICAHLFDGDSLPVSVLDALEAGLTAIKLDEARISRTILDMKYVFQKFDSYGLR